METLVCCRQDREWLGRPNVEVIPNGAVILGQPPASAFSGIRLCADGSRLEADVWSRRGTRGIRSRIG
jgi:hypothetical protein